MAGQVFPVWLYSKLKNLLFKNHQPDFEIISHKINVPGVNLYQDYSNYFDLYKNMAAKGRAGFPYMAIYQTSKVFLSEPTVRFWNNFIKMSLGWTSTKIVQIISIRQKTWPSVGRQVFPIWLYSKLKKNLLVRNHWPDFEINVPWVTL